VFVTGSADGLGLMAGRLLADEGHAVVLHARDDGRARIAAEALPAAERVVVGDVASIAGMRSVAEQAAATGPFDAVIHNVGVGYREPRRVETADGLSHVFAINVLAPYLLTAALPRPSRLVYLSSGMANGGRPDLEEPQHDGRVLLPPAAGRSPARGPRRRRTGRVARVLRRAHRHPPARVSVSGRRPPAARPRRSTSRPRGRARG
jgi:NAD(P)-dependent dehydrogenase (short-subunit alcohol dehydrogenase family)